MPRDRNSTPPGDYEIGYGKPPRHTRFKPGQSGNPNGRKKGVRTFKTVLEEELYRPVSVQEGGKQRMRPILSVILRQALAKAAKGETRALMPIIPLVQRAGLIGGEEPNVAIVQAPLSADEQALLREALAEVRAELTDAEDGR